MTHHGVTMGVVAQRATQRHIDRLDEREDAGRRCDTTSHNVTQRHTTSHRLDEREDAGRRPARVRERHARLDRLVDRHVERRAQRPLRARRRDGRCRDAAARRTAITSSRLMTTIVTIMIERERAPPRDAARPTSDRDSPS